MSEVETPLQPADTVSTPQAGARPRPELSPAKLALREARLRGELRAAPIAPRPREGDLPLSFAQERFWFLDRLRPGGASYNISDVTRLSGPLDAGALERALGEIVRRHESLRTVFRESDGVPSQVVVPFASFALPVDDLSEMEEPAREAEARRRTAAFTEAPFDLVAGPLFRAALLRLDPEEHVLLLCVHHIVADGMSMHLLFGELSALYGAFREGRPSPLPPLPLQYADFALWQREHWPTVEPAKVAYWTERLAGAPEVLELPTDHPRPPVPSYRGGKVPVRVGAEAAERLWAVAREEGATPFMAVLAAFQLLLARYAATDDVVVGTPVGGRARREVEGVIGPFLNTLLLRADLSGDPPFRALLRRVRERALADYAHQDVPFERLVAALRPERTLSHATLFQVLFQLDAAQPEGEGGGGMAGLRARGTAPEGADGRFDLALLLHIHAGGISGALHFSADLFEPETALRMAGHLERIVAGAGEDPDRRISRLELMGPDERERVAEWNRTAAGYPADRCIHHLFEAQAARTPDAVAVVHGSASLTFGALDRRANALAHRLRGRGVGPERRVGLCMERGPELLVAILAVMKAGGAYVPVDPAYPAERLAYMLEDSGAALLLTQARLRARLPAPGGVELLAVDELGAEERGDAPESGATSESLAYVIYTSGSTGRPKGVAMHHRGVCNYIHWGTRAYGADRGSGAPVFTSMAVDLTITNLLPLFVGRPVHLLPEEGAVEALARAMAARPRFGMVKITPIHLGLLNGMLPPEAMADAAHTLVIGADFLSAEPTVAWQERAPGVRLMNEYGPTETVVGCSAYILPPGKHRAGPVPVGRPIQNLTFHVLDAHLNPVPVGLPGELFIGGAGVARGYLGRPALSAEKFVPDPFAGAGARMYRTGDRARWLEGGDLLILGRADHQVKVRGYRVELGEVEAALRRFEGVRECVVLLREDLPGDRRLVAYVVSDTADPAALREHLRGALPEYMVPSAFVVLEAFPQTPTGKLDRKALPAPEYGAAAAVAEPPRNEVEEALLAIWEELLGVTGIGVTQSFFDLGGNSFLALRLFTRANRKLGCDLPVSTLFAGATVRHMADAVLEERRAAPHAPASVVPLQPNGSLPPVFFVHSVDRDVIGYVGLVRHLGRDQPAYGIRDVGEDLGRPIERIAAEHLAAIRAVQPAGPYHLVGWSFGGVVAFEMALQLERAGERVGFLGEMDTRSPALLRETPALSDEAVLTGLAAEVAEGERSAVALDPAALRGLPLEAQAQRVVEALHAQGAALSFTPAALLEAFRSVRDRDRSAEAYAPGRLAGGLTLFRAREEASFARLLSPAEGGAADALGWEAHVAGPVEVVPVPGSHVTLASEPHVRVLAARMREALAAARARAAAPEPVLASSDESPRHD